ncbi:MAG: hypothetical protein VKJ64_14405, partial [Leptolyngbyaceae bacterium]|nr:hypothetical protein [Leptolyngbyaceae bacterium]
MVSQPQAPLMSVTDYLEWEPRQELRYEFVWGRVFAMTGGTIPHNLIALNLIALNLYSVIRELTKGQGCRTFVNRPVRKLGWSTRAAGTPPQFSDD